MTELQPLTEHQIYHRCPPPEQMDFDTTLALKELDLPYGQDRMLRALEFGTAIQSHGFNLFVLGPSAAGKHEVVRQFLHRRAEGEAIPPDWCLLFNFQSPDKPRAAQLPAGQGRRLKEAIALLTGLPPGEADAEGGFPPGTFNRYVADRLAAFAEISRKRDRRDNGETGENGETREDDLGKVSWSGTPGRTLGSTARALAREAPGSVLLWDLGVVRREGPVMVVIDDFETSRGALKTALVLARQRQRPLTLLLLTLPEPNATKARDQALSEWLEQAQVDVRQRRLMRNTQAESLLEALTLPVIVST